MSSPAIHVSSLEAAATLRTTPCGKGNITWRIWGSGHPVVLLHGSAGSWTHWLCNISTLAASHTVYVPDLPGFGDSAALPAPHSFAALAAGLFSGLDALCPERPSFDLVGFSFGSVVAECMALARPEQVRQLVLVRGRFDDITPRPPATLAKWRHLTDPAELAAAQRHNLSVLMFHDGARIDEQAVHLHTENSRRAAVDPNAFFASRPSGALARLTMPVCGIAGEFDCLGLPDVALQGQALLRTRPDARFHLVPRAGHWVNYEAADAFNSILLAELGR